MERRSGFQVVAQSRSGAVSLLGVAVSNPRNPRTWIQFDVTKEVENEKKANIVNIRSALYRNFIIGTSEVTIRCVRGIRPFGKLGFDEEVDKQIV